MKLRLDGVTLYLGRLRRDGFRNVERVHLTDWRLLLPKLRRAKLKSKMVGKRLIVQTGNPDQMLLPFLQAELAPRPRPA